MSNRVFCGEFNSEQKFINQDYVTLPSFPGKAYDNKILLDGMDGMLLTMMNDNDVLLSRYPLPESYVQYWNQQISQIKNVSVLKKEEESESGIFHLISYNEDLMSFLQDKEIEEYAIVPELYEMLSKQNPEQTIPSLELIQELNSKAYSNFLKEKYDLPCKGVRVNDIAQFEQVANEMIREGAIIIKDVMGVSGKGVLVLENEKAVNRLSRHFQKQSSKKFFDFILEPYLHKTLDFSCQLTISNEGVINIQGLQKNNNRGFTYMETEDLESNEVKMIEESGYYEDVMNIAQEIKAKGYSGYICIDSMAVNDNSIVPLVEINPRMSMARFNLAMEKKLGHFKCCFSYVNVSSEKVCHIDKLMDELSERNLLFKKGSESGGIIPLAPNTWSLYNNCEQKVSLRIYYMVAYLDKELVMYKEKFRKCLNDMGVKVFQ